MLNRVEGFNDPLKIEHSLQIRIDDVPTNQAEIRNVYAAEVRYVGPAIPANPTNNCATVASAVFDAQAKVDELENRKKELTSELTDLQGKALEEAKSEMSFINNHLLPGRISNLRAAQFNYAECANVGFFRRKTNVHEG